MSSDELSPKKMILWVGLLPNRDEKATLKFRFTASEVLAQVVSRALEHFPICRRKDFLGRPLPFESFIGPCMTRLTGDESALQLSGSTIWIRQSALGTIHPDQHTGNVSMLSLSTAVRSSLDHLSFVWTPSRCRMLQNR
jgi:hypothetical protein